MSEYRAYMQNTKLHNGTKRKKRRHRFLFGVLLSALLITGALYGREYDISQLKNIEVMETLSSAVSQFGDRKLPVYSVQTTEKKIALSFDCAWGAEDFDSMMETLDKHNVKATFFMTGGFVSDNPECVKTLVEKGHEPGNHSEHHYDMATITAGEMNTYGEYNADGKKVPNPAAMPWEKNNFKGAFEMKSSDGNFGIRIEVQQGRNYPY